MKGGGSDRTESANWVCVAMLVCFHLFFVCCDSFEPRRRRGETK
jgi:hypothetical protein